MAGPYEMVAPITRPKLTGSGAPLALLAGLVGLAVLAATSLQAQPAPWDYPYYDGYPPPLPPGRVAARETRAYSEDNSPAYSGDNEGSSPVPLAEIRRHVAIMGFHLIATPRHKNRIYLAEAEDAHGLRHRIVFDAYDGKVIENTKLGLKTKRVAAKPNTETASASSAEKKVEAGPKPQPRKRAPVPAPVADPSPSGDPD